MYTSTLTSLCSLNININICMRHALLLWNLWVMEWCLETCFLPWAIPLFGNSFPASCAFLLSGLGAAEPIFRIWICEAVQDADSCDPFILPHTIYPPCPRIFKVFVSWSALLFSPINYFVSFHMHWNMLAVPWPSSQNVAIATKTHHRGIHHFLQKTCGSILHTYLNMAQYK